VALREALLNALVPPRPALASPVLVKQHPRKLEISNPGGLVGGITPANILHHPPLARNPLLVHALSKLRLVNRSNLGIGRMFESMLVEGKEPPVIVDEDSAVRVVFKRQETSARSARSLPMRARPAACSTWTTCWSCATCLGTPKSTPQQPPNSASGAKRRCATSWTRWCRCMTTWSAAVRAVAPGGAEAAAASSP
jgi:hypothetical protein